MAHIFLSGGVISLFVPKIILSFLFCLSLFILIGCICFSVFLLSDYWCIVFSALNFQYWLVFYRKPEKDLSFYLPHPCFIIHVLRSAYYIISLKYSLALGPLNSKEVAKNFLSSLVNDTENAEIIENGVILYHNSTCS